jgi:cell division protein ZapD
MSTADSNLTEKMPAKGQESLFAPHSQKGLYELPLSERMRTLMRLESIFHAIHLGLQRGETWDARNVLVNMIELCDQLGRMDIRGELIKELERHVNLLQHLRHNPQVNQDALERTMGRLQPLLILLKSNAFQPGARLRQSELLMQFKQRLALPGATCNFDIPGLHFWLHREPMQRDRQLHDWMRDLRVIEDAVQLVLELVRVSAQPRQITVENGFYQQQIEPGSQCQMVRVKLRENADYYPEISGGRHRFAIRFFRHTDPDSRPQVVQESLNFELHCCAM